MNLHNVWYTYIYTWTWSSCNAKRWLYHVYKVIKTINISLNLTVNNNNIRYANHKEILNNSANPTYWFAEWNVKHWKPENHFAKKKKNQAYPSNSVDSLISMLPSPIIKLSALLIFTLWSVSERK